MVVVTTFVTWTYSATISATPVFVNEIHYDNSGVDVEEGVEIVGPAGTVLDDWTLVFYNGSSGIPYRTLLLTGVISDQENGYGTLFFPVPTNGIQNGSPDGLALIDAIENVSQFLSYEGEFEAVGGPANGLRSITIGQEEGNSNPTGYSLQLVGTGSLYDDFDWSPPSRNTFGRTNAGQTFLGTADLVSVPEPTTVLLMGVGLLSMSLTGRRHSTA
jgi:hypothetical protein